MFLFHKQTSEEGNSQSDEDDGVRPIKSCILSNLVCLPTVNVFLSSDLILSYYSLYLHRQTLWLKPEIIAWAVRRMFERWDKHFAHLNYVLL